MQDYEEFTVIPPEEAATPPPVPEVEPPAAQASAEVEPTAGPGWPAEEGPPLMPVRRGTGRAGGYGGVILVLLVLLLASLAGFGKLWLDWRAAGEALAVAVTTLPAKVGSPQVLESVQRQLEVIGEDVRAGRFALVRQRVEEAQPPPPPEAGLGITPSAPGTTPAPEITPQMKAFFNARPQLEQRFVEYLRQSKQLKAQGREVQPLREARDAVLEAARLGNEMSVRTGLDRYEQLLRQAGTNPGQASPVAGNSGLQEKLQRIKQVSARAGQQGRDISPAARLMPQLEAAMKAGDLDRASILADQVLDKLEHAPRARGGSGAGRGRMVSAPTGPPPGVAQRLVIAFLSLTQTEERDLAAINQSLEHAKLALREYNSDQIGELLNEAGNGLRRIEQRRREFSQAVNRSLAASGGGQSRPQSQPTAAQPTTAAGEAQGPVARVVEILATVRTLSAEEFEKSKLDLARQLLGAMLPRRPTPAATRPGAAPGQQPSAQATAADNAATESRVRAKLQMAAEPYELMKREGKDVADAQRLLQLARSALSKRDYPKAEELADQALVLLGVTPAPTGP